MSAITINPISWQWDTLTAKATATISTASTYSVDLTRAQTVTGITVSGTQPPSTSRYIAFKLNNQWGCLDASGNFAAFTVNTSEATNLEENGNIPSDLTRLTNIPALAGKTFGVAFCLVSEDPDNAKPTIGLTFKCRNSSQQLVTSKYSPVYQLGAKGQIMSIDVQSSVTGTGSVEVLGQATYSDGTKSDWKSYDNFTGEKCTAIQLRADYRVNSVGGGSAKLTTCRILYSDGSTVTSGMTSGEIITRTLDWYMPIHQCRLTVKHAHLENATLRCYATFRDAPSQVHGEQLGIGSGGRKTFGLGRTGGIKYDTFKLYYDGAQVFVNYELNCEAGRVTCEAPSGSIVTCDYEYGWDSEIWEEMSLSSRLDYGDYEKSEYRLSTPSNLKSASAVKLVLGMTSGTISGETLGTGTGSSRTYKLSKRVRDGRISITSGSGTLAGKNWRLHEGGDYVTINGPSGQVLKAYYDWISATPTVYELAAVYAA